MLENPVLDHLSQHLRANHDNDWFFEHIDFDGSLAFNCYLPTDSPETFVMIRWADHKIVGYGDNVPQGLLDEIQKVIADGEFIYIDGNWENNQEKWA
jgi:hypothetical protein